MLNIVEKKAYVVGTQKNRLTETVPWSTQNTCLILVRKSIPLYEQSDSDQRASKTIQQTTKTDKFFFVICPFRVKSCNILICEQERMLREQHKNYCYEPNNWDRTNIVDSAQTAGGATSLGSTIFAILSVFKQII